MDGMTIRDAGPADANVIAQLVRRMVADMASHGGHAPALDDATWDKVTDNISEELRGDQAKYLIAESRNGVPLGVAGGQITALGGAFAPRQTMHISAIYVVPELRRAGIASRLLEALLAWGRAAGGEECDLNMLANSPARALYERHGFSVFQLKLIRSLRQ
jgi:ribosomal protein S18 acetylase RimI-like enzyme